jgi:hypothetical protein
MKLPIFGPRKEKEIAMQAVDFRELPGCFLNKVLIDYARAISAAT